MQPDRFYGAGVPCHGAIFYLVGDLPNAAQCVVEELLVAFAKVALFFV